MIPRFVLILGILIILAVYALFMYFLNKPAPKKDTTRYWMVTYSVANEYHTTWVSRKDGLHFEIDWLKRLIKHNPDNSAPLIHFIQEMSKSDWDESQKQIPPAIPSLQTSYQ